ncbi:unnamed protein product [Enterobius vermicularis]|uniref:Peptidase A1 domain-containing protein n=1 Tax=Enterobius vermicularis TaxID=51028 RepID=A0A0N4V207_ENTVE|nr:unnamed protein product [Enterobius vermicularis]
MDVHRLFLIPRPSASCAGTPIAAVAACIRGHSSKASYFIDSGTAAVMINDGSLCASPPLLTGKSLVFESSAPPDIPIAVVTQLSITGNVRWKP